jgi:hypothetical protein
MRWVSTVLVIAALVMSAAGAGAQQQPAAPVAVPGTRAVVLQIAQTGTMQGITGGVQGAVTQDAILTAFGEALQAQGVSMYSRPTPGVSVLDLAGQISITERQVVLAQQQVVDVVLYARLINPDGSTWYTHGSGSATATTMANSYGGYGGYGSQVPARTVQQAITKAVAALVPGVVGHLEPVATGPPAPCAPATTGSAPGGAP